MVFSLLKDNQENTVVSVQFRGRLLASQLLRGLPQVGRGEPLPGEVGAIAISKTLRVASEEEITSFSPFSLSCFPFPFPFLCCQPIVTTIAFFPEGFWHTSSEIKRCVRNDQTMRVHWHNPGSKDASK